MMQSPLSFAAAAASASSVARISFSSSLNSPFLALSRIAFSLLSLSAFARLVRRCAITIQWWLV